jgi:hypothetical protein
VLQSVLVSFSRYRRVSVSPGLFIEVSSRFSQSWSLYQGIVAFQSVLVSLSRYRRVSVSPGLFIEVSSRFSQS